MTDELAPRLSTGDERDDDVAALQQQAQHSANGPAVSTLPAVPYAQPYAMPVMVSGLMTVSQVMTASWVDGWQALPRDEGREKLLIIVRPYSATDTVRLADSRTSLGAASLCATLGAGTYDLGAHTGPVWLSSPDLTDSALVSIIAVTK